MIPPFVASRAAAPPVAENADTVGGEILYHPPEASDAMPLDVATPEAVDAERDNFLDSLGEVEVEEDRLWGGDALDAPLMPTGEFEPSAPADPAIDLPGWLEGVVVPSEAPTPASEFAAPEAAPAAEPGAGPVIDQVASRLEEIARSLRTKSPAELLSRAGEGVADPLELLITGFVLGYSQKPRPADDPGLD